jgi:hypothetical protein
MARPFLSSAHEGHDLYGIPVFEPVREVLSAPHQVLVDLDGYCLRGDLERIEKLANGDSVGCVARLAIDD